MISFSNYVVHEVMSKVAKSNFAGIFLLLITAHDGDLSQQARPFNLTRLYRDGNMILAKYVAWYSWLAMDAFFDVVANLVPRGKEFPFCMALAYSSSTSLSPSTLQLFSFLMREIFPPSLD